MPIDPGHIQIAFIGLGHMGAPMAARLVHAGFALRVHDRERPALDAFAALHGARACASAGAAASGADVVIAMLPGPQAVADAFLGSSDGAAATAADEAILVDMGTTPPEATRRLAGDTAAFAARSGRRLHYVDAPVMGGVPFACDGSLEILAGGDSATIDRLASIFAALGQSVRRCGELGTGHAFKAIANFVNAATLTTLAEALVLGRQQGLGTPFMVDALTTLCTGRQHPLLKKIAPHVVTRRFGSGMSLGLTAKDLGIAAGLAAGREDVAPVAHRMHAIWEAAVRLLGADADQTEIVRAFEDAASVRV